MSTADEPTSTSQIASAPAEVPVAAAVLASDENSNAGDHAEVENLTRRLNELQRIFTSQPVVSASPLDPTKPTVAKEDKSSSSPDAGNRRRWYIAGSMITFAVIIIIVVAIVLSNNTKAKGKGPLLDLNSTGSDAASNPQTTLSPTEASINTPTQPSSPSIPPENNHEPTQSPSTTMSVTLYPTAEATEEPQNPVFTTKPTTKEPTTAQTAAPTKTPTLKPTSAPASTPSPQLSAECQSKCSGLQTGTPVIVNGEAFQQAILEYLQDHHHLHMAQLSIVGMCHK